MHDTDSAGQEQRQQALVALFGKAPIKKSMGMELSYDEQGCAIFDMPYHPGFDHALNGIHGGVIATLLDNAGWFTAAALYDSWIATAEMQVRYLEPVAKAHLIAQGRIIRAGKRMAMTEMEVRTQDGRRVAVGSGTFVVTSLSTE
jgi:uncharacterized protein (TIGR00369 family)